MIPGDNPLTAVHVAGDLEIVDRDALILDVPEGSSSLVWRSVDDSVNIVMDPSQPIDTSLKEFILTSLKRLVHPHGWRWH